MINMRIWRYGGRLLLAFFIIPVVLLSRGGVLSFTVIQTLGQQNLDISANSPPVSHGIRKLENRERAFALGRRTDEMSPSQNRSVVFDTEVECQQRTERVYTVVLEKLQRRSTTTIEEVTGEMRQSDLVADGYFFGLSALDTNPQPALLAWFTCPLSVVEGHSTFRIFKFSHGRYHPVAESEQFPVMGHVNRVGQRLDHGLLEVQQIPSSPSDPAHFLTRWIVGGSTPQVFSAILWQWDGQQLKPIWERLDLHGASVKILGPMITLSVRMGEPQEFGEEAQKPIWRDEVYRLEKGKVVFDGVLDQALAQRYFNQGLITSMDGESLTEWAYIFERFGAKDTAIQLLKEAVRTDPDYTRPYYTLSRICEDQGDYAEAAKWMQRLAEAAGGLSPQGRHRLQELERKTKKDP